MKDPPKNKITFFLVRALREICSHIYIYIYMLIYEFYSFVFFAFSRGGGGGGGGRASQANDSKPLTWGLNPKP